MSEEPERKILAQDLAQYQQSQRVGGTAKRREAEAAQSEYESQVSQYNQEQKAAEEKYQRELAEYEKSQDAQREKDAIEKKYNTMLQELESNKSRDIIAAREGVEGNDTSARKARAVAQGRVEEQYKKMIDGVTREKNSVLLPILLKEEGYPQYAIDKATRAYSSGKALTVGSAMERAETLVKGKEAQAERSRVISIQDALNAPSYTKQQETRIDFGTAYLSGRSTESMQARAQDIKSTPNVITGKQAEKTRAPLTMVKTVENIYGGQQIETNPRAFVASLTRQEVTPAGKPIEPKPIIPISPAISEPVGENDRWQVEIDGKIRTFKTKEAAQEYIQRRTPKETFGPVFQKQESVYLPAGSLQYLIETKQIQPDLKKLLTPKSEFSKTPQGPQRARPLESAIQFTSDIGKKYKDIQPIAFTAGAIEEGLGIIGGTINLIEQGKQKLGEIAPIKYPIKEVKKPYSLPSSPFEYPVDITYGTILGGQSLTQAEKQARERQIQIIKEEGGYRYTGKAAVAIATIPFRGIFRTGEKITSGLVSPIKREAKSFLEKRTANMLDVGKQKKTSAPFSYETPYKPAKRANEIDVSDFGERIGPSSLRTQKPIAARQSDVMLPRKTKTIPIKEDRLYKPARRTNEIDISRDNVLVEFRTEKIKLGKGATIIPEKPIRGKVIEPVKPEPFYQPAKRPNEIDLSRDVGLTQFSKTKIKLGKGTIQPDRYQVRGKQVKPVEEDFFYKPAKRANEIDLSDSAGEIKMPKIEPEKSEISLDLKRELKRLKRKQPEFKVKTIGLGGEGQYIAGKSGKQGLILIQKQESITQKKLLTKRKTPLSIDWSEKLETVKVPKTERSPIQILTPLREKKKRVAYLKESVVTSQAYEIPLSEQRPQIKSIPKMEIKTEFRMASPQRESFKMETPQAQRITTRPKQLEKQRMKTIEIQISRQRSMIRQTQKMTQPEPFRFPSAQPVRLAQPAKLKQPTKQVLRYREPEIRPSKGVIGGLLPKDNKIPKSVLKKQKENANYLGSSSEMQITGLFKRQDITYGQKKIARLLKGDVRVVQGKQRSTRRTKEKKDMFGFSKKKDKTKFF